MPTLRRLVMVVVAGAVLLAPATAGAHAGNVLPATAHPKGWSLTRMTDTAALFNSSSGSDLSVYPSTPFQILYVDPATETVTPVGSGYLLTGTNQLVVHPGTMFYVPLQSVSDSPPVIGVYPTTHAGAVSYFFDPAQVGASGYTVTVDGTPTPLDHGYLAGPVSSSRPLLDGGGHHIMTLGAFLTPLPAGTHTVEIAGGLFGAGIGATYPFSFLEEDFTYTVVVRPGT